MSEPQTPLQSPYILTVPSTPLDTYRSFSEVNGNLLNTSVKRILFQDNKSFLSIPSCA